MSENIETNKLFVGNLHWHVRWQELKEFFSQWGEVEYASVALDRETRKSRGFGFVTFVHADDAGKAKTEANEQELQGRPIYIDFARARDDEAAPADDEQQEEQEEQTQELEEEQQEEQEAEQQEEEENQEE